MFKSLIDNASTAQLMNAVLMLLSAVAMMVGLGMYLWLSRENKSDHS
ncbi:hypothetical protein [Nitrincola nitratireducens]|nr:hypothetical protein [Nitrincola nitratireducens]